MLEIIPISIEQLEGLLEGWQYPPYFAPYFLEAASLKGQVEVYLLEEKGLPRAIFVSYHHRRAYSPQPFAQYQGLYPLEELRVVEVLELYRKLPMLLRKHYFFVDKISPSLSEKLLPLRAELGRIYRVEQRFSQEISLGAFSSVEDYLSRLPRIRRYEVRRAMREGFTLAPSTALTSFLDQLKSFSERKGFPVDLKAVELFISRLVENGRGQLWALSEREEVRHYIFTLYHQNKLYILFHTRQEELPQRYNLYPYAIYRLLECYWAELDALNFAGSNIDSIRGVNKSLLGEDQLLLELHRGVRYHPFRLL